MLWFRRRPMVKLPPGFVVDPKVVAELNDMVQTYNRIDRKHFKERDDYFWKCYIRICACFEEHRLFIYAGDCKADSLRSIIENDGPEYAAIIIFGASATDFYMIGVCVRGIPILRKVDLASREVKKSIQVMSGRIGTHFEEQ